MAKILVVDDEAGIRELLSEILHDEGHDIELAEHAAAARASRARTRPDLVLLDIWMPDTDGITLLKEWAAGGLLTMPVVMMSGHATIDTAVEATRIGAQDFLEKPISLQKLLATVKQVLQKSVVVERRSEPTLAALGRSVAVRDLKRRLEQIARKSRIVLLKSGPGSLVEPIGRQLLAPGKSWFDLGQHSEALTLDLLEQMAGGLLFAAELSALSRLQQKNLLFASERLEKFDLQLVAASSQDVHELRANGFEQALLQRLAGASLAVPGLAELKDDIPEFAAQILACLVEAGEVPMRRLSTSAMNVLRNQPWPGGYDELRAAVRSLALTALEEDITEEEVVRLMAPHPTQGVAAALPIELPLREARDAFERLYFEHHLRVEEGNIARVAEKSGLERTNLYRKLRSLGIQLRPREDDQ